MQNNIAEIFRQRQEAFQNNNSEQKKGNFDSDLSNNEEENNNKDGIKEPPEFPLKLEQKILMLLGSAESATGNEQRSSALKAIWDYISIDFYKFSFCYPSYHFLERLVMILRTANSLNDLFSLANGVGCIWYLSREPQARKYICSPELPLFSYLFELMKSEPRVKINILKALSNCSLSSETHSILFSSKYCYLEILREHLLYESSNETETAFLFQAVQHCISTMSNSSIDLVIANNLPGYALNTFIELPEKPLDWPNRFSGINYWILNNLMSLSSLPRGAQYLYQTNKYSAFVPCLKYEVMESVKSFIVLANISPFHRMERFDSYNLYLHLIPDYLHIFNLLIDVYYVIHHYKEDSKETRQLVQRGFAFSIITLRDVTSAFKNLAICPFCPPTPAPAHAHTHSCPHPLLANNTYRKQNFIQNHQGRDCHRRIMLINPKLLSLICESIYLFIKNTPEISTSGQVGAKVFGGGGGKDYDTILHLLELLIQLSYYQDPSYNDIMIGNDQAMDVDNEGEIRTEEFPPTRIHGISILSRFLFNPFPSPQTWPITSNPLIPQTEPKTIPLIKLIYEITTLKRKIPTEITQLATILYQRLNQES